MLIKKKKPHLHFKIDTFFATLKIDKYLSTFPYQTVYITPNKVAYFDDNMSVPIILPKALSWV